MHRTFDDETNSYYPSPSAASTTAIVRIHYEELSKYLTTYDLAKAPVNSNSATRQKITRLTGPQFEELSTDIYDEVVRRKNTDAPSFLPARDNFHPKRNEARQKLATLPSSRFESICGDVYIEIPRRYPEFKDRVYVDEKDLPIDSSSSP